MHIDNATYRVTLQINDTTLVSGNESTVSKFNNLIYVRTLIVRIHAKKEERKCLPGEFLTFSLLFQN